MELQWTFWLGFEIVVKCFIIASMIQQFGACETEEKEENVLCRVYETA